MKLEKIKDLEKIIKVQERIIEAWHYSYWALERKLVEALADIRFLNHYIKKKK